MARQCFWGKNVSFGPFGRVTHTPTAGFLKSWGYRQFARAIEKAVIPKAAEAERSACSDIARNEWRARKELHDQEGQPQDIQNMHHAGMQSAALINLAIRKRGTGGAG